MADVKIDVANVGENIGVQATDESGNVVGSAWSWLAHFRKGKTVVHSRVEVDGAAKGKGIGGKLVDALTEKMAEVGGIIHEEGFSEQGEKLKPRFMSKGYTKSSESGDVIEKEY